MCFMCKDMNQAVNHVTAETHSSFGVSADCWVGGVDVQIGVIVRFTEQVLENSAPIEYLLKVEAVVFVGIVEKLPIKCFQHPHEVLKSFLIEEFQRYLSESLILVLSTEVLRRICGFIVPIGASDRLDNPRSFFSFFASTHQSLHTSILSKNKSFE